jgi:hypothetical protein
MFCSLVFNYARCVSTAQLTKSGDVTSLRRLFVFLNVGERYRDLDEAAVAADATACSRDGCFRVSKFFSASSGNMLLCQDFPLQRNAAVGMAQATKWRNGH